MFDWIVVQVVYGCVEMSFTPHDSVGVLKPDSPSTLLVFAIYLKRSATVNSPDKFRKRFNVRYFKK